MRATVIRIPHWTNKTPSRSGLNKSEMREEGERELLESHS
jgi:hypothetical protein